MRRLATVLLLTLVALVPLAHAADRAKPLAVGDRAPDFTLLDQDGKPVKLSDLLSRREAVVVAFYIKADTPG